MRRVADLKTTDLKTTDLAEVRRVPEGFFRHFRRPGLYARWLAERAGR